jgi:processive 1,2-diacylglycerol beta-glucosyltransferase
VNFTKEKFILILSCSGGAGHLRAAEALHQASSRLGLPLRTETYDVLDFTTPLFKRLYSESYLAAVNRIPDLWGYFYARSESKLYDKKGLIRLFDRLNYKNYLSEIGRMRPDAILCTHFLPFISISNRVRGDKLFPPFFAATTDFDVHSLWVDPIVRRYFVFSDESRWQLGAKGVDREKISVTGIPVLTEFAQRRRTSVVRSELQIPKDNFTILILSGGFGIGRIEKIVRTVIDEVEQSSRKPITVLVVCGKNKSAMERLSNVETAPRITLRAFGFVRNMHDLMDAANLLVSKSGGLTASEALAKQLPMLIIDPIPGQESRNADMLVEQGAAWKAINLPNLAYKLRMLLEKPAMLQSARVAAKRLGKPNASATILNIVYSEISRKASE